MADSLKSGKVNLPDRITTKFQLNQVFDEVELILEQAIQGHIRREQTGAAFTVNKPSEALQEMLEMNSRQLTLESLQQTKKELELAKTQAIVIRVVLTAEPNAAVKAKIVRWFRDMSDQIILLRFGIQPSIAGGCLIYTPNHMYDLSLRNKITDNELNMREIIDTVGV